MKAFAIISVARQVDGEYVIVKVEKAFTDTTKAQTFAQNLASRYHEEILMPNGVAVSCICERGVFEIEIES